MPPGHIVSQMASTLDLISPVIIDQSLCREGSGSELAKLLLYCCRIAEAESTNLLKLDVDGTLQLVVMNQITLTS